MSFKQQAGPPSPGEQHDMPLVRLFGDHPKAKIISSLITASDRDINITDISRISDVSRSAVYDHIDELIELGLVVRTREVSGSPLYQINLDSDIVTQVAQLRLDLRDHLDD